MTDESVLRAQSERNHFVYMACCADGTLYTGYATDIDRRIAAHNAGTGARYTRSRRPITVIATWSFTSQAEALRAECAIKRLPRSRKLVIAGVPCGG